MRILVTAFAYNEMKYIPEMVNYYRNQGCDLLILDNYSTDGTFEWLQKNGIKTRQINTNESFHLGILQTELLKDIKKESPDWVVYTGIDFYYIFDKTIRETILDASMLGHNIIEVRHCTAYNTGEERGLPLQNYFFHIARNRNLQLIAKYDQGFNIFADDIKLKFPNVFKPDGFSINYGCCKSAKEREETFARRKKAWDSGMTKGWGTHYLVGKEKNWIWEKEELIDIRKTDDWKYIQKILL